MNFKQKKKTALSNGTTVRKEERGSMWLWFCPGECWMGYFDTAKEAWQQSFQWYGLDPMTNENLKTRKASRQEMKTSAV